MDFFSLFQTDYNRHLEQLIEEMENILIDILRTRLNKDSLQQVIQLHKQLENVQNLSDGNKTFYFLFILLRGFLCFIHLHFFFVIFLFVLLYFRWKYYDNNGSGDKNIFTSN